MGGKWTEGHFELLRAIVYGSRLLAPKDGGRSLPLLVLEIHTLEREEPVRVGLLDEADAVINGLVRTAAIVKAEQS